MEVQQVLTAYLLMVIFFALSTLSSFWIEMQIRGATICSLIFVFSSYFWWYYCLRIYNRFQYVVDFDSEYDQKNNPSLNRKVKKREGIYLSICLYIYLCIYLSMYLTLY
jgi:hypothetical protein